MPDQEPNPSGAEPNAASPFPATRWSLVLMVGHEDTAIAARALEDLCRQYWQPIYFWLRRQGHAQHDAEDLTQSFFAKILANDALASVRKEKGRLRTFLLAALQRHVIDTARRDGAQRRGGTAVRFSLDVEEAERCYEADLIHGQDPAQLYLRAWARAVMDESYRRLRQHYSTSGKALLFQQLSEFLKWNDRSTPYREIAVRLKMGEPALRVQVFRMRNHYRRFLEEEIAQTVSTPSELQEELNFLRAVLTE